MRSLKRIAKNLHGKQFNFNKVQGQIKDLHDFQKLKTKHSFNLKPNCKNYSSFLTVTNLAKFSTNSKAQQFCKIPSKKYNFSRNLFQQLSKITSFQDFQNKKQFLLNQTQYLLKILKIQQFQIDSFFIQCSKKVEQLKNCQQKGIVTSKQINKNQHSQSIFKSKLLNDTLKRQQFVILYSKYFGFIYQKLKGLKKINVVDQMQKFIKKDQYQNLLQCYFNSLIQQTKVQAILNQVENDQSGITKKQLKIWLTDYTFTSNIHQFSNILLFGHQYIFLEDEQTFQKVKKGHLKLVTTFLKLFLKHQGPKNQLLNILRLNHLFPINLFNVTDLPILLDIFNIYLFPFLNNSRKAGYSLKQQLNLMQANIQTLNRFIQTPFYYLKQVSLTIKRIVDQNSCLQMQDCFRLINIIYLLINQTSVQYLSNFWNAIETIKNCALKLINQNYIKNQKGDPMSIKSYFNDFSQISSNEKQIVMVMYFRYLIVNYQVQNEQNQIKLKRLISQLEGQKIANFIKKHLGFADIFQILMKFYMNYEAIQNQKCLKEYQLKSYQKKINDCIADIHDVSKKLLQTNSFSQKKYQRFNQQEIISKLISTCKQTEEKQFNLQNQLNSEAQICRMLSQNIQFLAQTLSQNTVKYLKQSITKRVIGFQGFALNWNYPFRCDIALEKSLASNPSKKQCIMIQLHFKKYGYTGKGNGIKNKIIERKNHYFDKPQYVKVTHKKFAYNQSETMLFYLRKLLNQKD